MSDYLDSLDLETWGRQPASRVNLVYEPTYGRKKAASKLNRSKPIAADYQTPCLAWAKKQKNPWTHEDMYEGVAPEHPELQKTNIRGVITMLLRKEMIFKVAKAKYKQNSKWLHVDYKSDARGEL